MRGERARLTLPDVVMMFATIAFSAPLIVVLVDGMEVNSGVIPTGALYFYQMLVPGVVLVALAVMFRKATAGGGR